MLVAGISFVCSEIASIKGRLPVRKLLAAGRVRLSLSRQSIISIDLLDINEGSRYIRFSSFLARTATRLAYGFFICRGLYDYARYWRAERRAPPDFAITP